MEIKHCFLFITEFLLTLSYKVEFAAYKTSTVFLTPLAENVEGERSVSDHFHVKKLRETQQPSLTLLISGLGENTIYFID